MMKLTAEQKALRRRILEVSFHRKLSHIGSCVSAVDIISAIYKTKKHGERFILSCGHAGIALYAVLERYGILAPGLIDRLPIHPERDPKKGIDVSTGSLGQGLPIALGMALADRKKNVYCLLSDGECTEGSVREALEVTQEREVRNLKIIINANGWGAYHRISLPLLVKRIGGFGFPVKTVSGHRIDALSRLLARRPGKQPCIIVARTSVEQFPFLKGQDAHYHVMSQREYRLAMDTL